MLVCGSLPFDGPTLQALRNVVIEGKFRIPYFMSQGNNSVAEPRIRSVALTIVVIISECEHLIRHMLVVEPEKRLSLLQIAKHRWLSNALPVDTGPEKELQLNKTVIDHMLQLPGLNQSMILQSIKNNSFDHIYAIYNLLVDKLHQRTVNFQTKLSQRQDVEQKKDDAENEHVRPPRINERSESFNETLVTHLNSETSSKSTEVRRQQNIYSSCFLFQLLFRRR